MVLSAAMNLERGSLKVTLPDLRRILVVGKAPGPDAEVTLNNWKLPAPRLRRRHDRRCRILYRRRLGKPRRHQLPRAVRRQCRGRRDGRRQRQLDHGDRPAHPPLAERRTPARGSRKNISAHYDLGNAFYKEWLDPTMTYSSALFSTGANDLESAQTAKYRALARDLGIGPGDHVLEIGCGWGGFAEFAAREIGCRVTGLTISQEQHDFAVAAHRQGRPVRQGRDQAAGLPRRDRQIRPHRLDRDVRGGRREILAGLLRQGEGLPQGRRHGRHADHHHQRAGLPDLPQAARTSSSATSFRAACCRRRRS